MNTTKASLYSIILAILTSSFLLFPLDDSITFVNGNFEAAFGGPDLSGWTGECGGLTSSTDTPIGAGGFSLRTVSGDSQQCSTAYVYQIISGVSDGDMVTINGFAKKDASVPPTTSVGIYLGAYSIATQKLCRIYGDSTNYVNWTGLNSTGNITLGANELPAVILDPGTYSGPAPAYAFFDNITLDNVTTKCELSVEIGDFCVESPKSGVVLKSPSGICYRIRVDDSGMLQTEITSCP